MNSASDTQDVQPLRVGTMLDGRYRIDSVLGAGAMGCVYLGEHVGIGRTVAIKVLRADLGGSQDATQRFKREALASGRLDHPNIVGVSDFGVLEDGSSFLVMEALQGESLGERLGRERRISWPEAVELIRGVLRGLHHAHQRGVVHRDDKPDNIFLATQDGRPVVKLLDFGIAKLVAGTTDDPAATRTGITMGTPAYLSPEQAVGGEITAASDLYSATVVLFEMLTGGPLFEEPNLVAIMMAHVSRQPRALAEAAPDLTFPPQLEDLVQRGLQKRVADRIASAAEYLELLDGVEIHARVSARHETPKIELPPLADSPAAVRSQPLGPITAPPPTLQSQPLLAMPYDGASSQPMRRPASIADAAEPIPRTWLLGGGIALGGALVLAVVAAAAGNGGRSAIDGMDAERPLPGARPTASTTPSRHTPDPPPTAVTPPVPVAEAATADRDVQMKALLYDLKGGRTCAERRAAIPKLLELDDPRAIPALKAARYRMRGGFAGFRQSNTNECLRKDAEAAIKTLGKPR